MGGHFWAILTHFVPFQPFVTTSSDCAQSQILAIFDPFSGSIRLLRVRFWPFLYHFGLFWALLDQNWGDPCTSKWIKTSTKTSSNLFHAVPTCFGSPECSSKSAEAYKHYWPQKGPFWAIGARKRPAEQPNGHLPEN